MAKSLIGQRLNEPILNFVRQDYVHILADQTVAEALDYARQNNVASRIVYFYVVDRDNVLQGVVPTRRLLLSPPDKLVREIMVANVVTLPTTATLFDACDLFLFHRLLALPVVDEQRRIAGIVDVELYTAEVSDVARHAESDDIFQLIGVHVSAVQTGSVPVVFGNRFPWLLCNIVGGLACAVVAGYYEGILDRVIALALFIPVVLALAESVSIQSLTLTLQAQHGAKFNWSSLLKNLRREIPVGLLLGVACGGLVALVAWGWQRHGMVAVCILASIALSIAAATLYGLLVPTVLRAVQRDPKVASGPITLAVTDITTLFLYLGLATWLLR
jgi:magnesium transporter